jgi:hypothetical protein
LSELTLITGIIFLLLSFVFLVTGFILNIKLKKCFPSFYNKIKVKVLIATILLSVSLCARAILNLVRFSKVSGLDDSIYISEIEDTYIAPLYNVILFVFSDAVPLCA